MLITFSGKKQSGKDTCADIVAALSPKLTFQRLNFADALYEEVAHGLWPTIEYNKDLTLEKVAYIKSYKDNFRLLLQGWGTDYRRKLCGENYWIDKYKIRLSRIPDKIVVMTTDVRFLNEIECIKSLGGIIVRVERPRNGTPDLHISETGLDNYQFDFTIQNDGTIEDLKEKFKIIKQ